MITCKEPGVPENGYITYNNENITIDKQNVYGFNTSVSFVCDEGYELQGVSKTTCQEQGWINANLTCLR